MCEEDKVVELATTSGAGQAFPLGTQVEEIAYESLNSNDEIIIQTANSRYRFSVTDPDHHRGLLSGGSLGDNPYIVTFAGTLHEEKGRDLSETARLKTQARALFYIESQNGLKRMVTSRIIGLFLLNNRSF